MDLIDILKAVSPAFGAAANISEAAKKAGAAVGEKEAGKPVEEETGVFAWLKRLGFGSKAEKVKEEAKQERSGILGEFIESYLAREYPFISKLADLSSWVGLTRKDTAVLPWQNEFENFTVFASFFPDFLLRRLTDPLVRSSIFQALVEHWPKLGEKWVKKMKASKVDPDDVISVIRIMEQDLVSGTLSSEKLLSILNLIH